MIIQEVVYIDTKNNILYIAKKDYHMDTFYSPRTYEVVVIHDIVYDIDLVFYVPEYKRIIVVVIAVPQKDIQEVILRKSRVRNE